MTRKQPRKRPRIGDVVELPTPQGMAYAQYTHKHDAPPRYGAVIRVLPGLFGSRPTDFAALVKQKERFYLFFPLGAACNRGIVTIVSNEEIPDWASPFPLFRSRQYPLVRSESYSGPTWWWLWDGEKDWRVDDLTPEQRNLPILSVWNDTLLVDRIVEGWAPADEP